MLSPHGHGYREDFLCREATASVADDNALQAGARRQDARGGRTSLPPFQAATASTTTVNKLGAEARRRVARGPRTYVTGGERRPKQREAHLRILTPKASLSGVRHLILSAVDASQALGWPLPRPPAPSGHFPLQLLFILSSG